MPYEDKIMVASGDSEHPGTEEVGFETIPRRGGEGHTYDIKFTNNSEDLTLTEDGTDKTSLHLWTTIKEKIKSILHIGDNTIDDITDVYGAKNLIPKQSSYSIVSDASGGWTDPAFNSNGTIDFGSFSGGTYCYCVLDLALSLPKTGDYIFTSGLTDASNSTAYIEVYKTNNATPIKVYNEPVVIENINFIHHVILVSIDGHSRLFKPMLRLASIESNEYVPFAMTNKQLTDLVITKEILHPVGTVIHSTTCDTMAKVIATYGGTTWIQLSGYMLRGATSGVTPNSNQNDGGADSQSISSVAQHTHTQNSHNHTQNSHNHTQNSHNHTQNSHSHTQYGVSNASTSGTAPTMSFQGDGNVVIYYSNGVGAVGLGNTSGRGGQGPITIGGAQTRSVSGTTATNIAQTATNIAQTATNQAQTATNQNAGATYSVATLPKYKNVYIWERTA